MHRDDGGRDGAWEGSQFKSKADMRAHREFVRALEIAAPGIPVVSEEDDASHRSRRSGRCFLVDPLDGTASYAEGFPGFVTQVALMEAGRPVTAVVYAPALDLLWSASRGGGAFLGASRLRLARPPGRLLVIDNDPQPRGAAALMRGLGATGYVECGSIGLKACRVADGTADLFVKDVIVRDWDVAPADLIMSEAGGQLTDRNGRPYSYDGYLEKDGLVAAADTETAARALAILAEVQPR